MSSLTNHSFPLQLNMGAVQRPCFEVVSQLYFPRPKDSAGTRGFPEGEDREKRSEDLGSPTALLSSQSNSAFISLTCQVRKSQVRFQ